MVAELNRRQSRLRPRFARWKMAPRVPPELTDRIIDHLWDSQVDLRACSLVCSQWLPTSRRHMFENITVRRDTRFLALVQCPSNVIANYTRAVDFRLWSPDMHDDTCRILAILPNLEDLTVGEIPPSPESFPVLSRVRKLSLQRTKFASCADFALFISKFSDLRDLELGWITWAGGHYDVWSHLELQLEHLSIRGFEQAPHILQWLSSVNHSPQTRGFSFVIPNDVAPDPAALNVISKFLHRLDGHLEYLRLEVYPSTFLQWILVQLNLGRLTSLQCLRIGHGVHFYPPSTTETLGTCRVFPAVLQIAQSIAAKCQLKELIFDVDIAPDRWSSNSGSFLRNILTDQAVTQIPAVRFHVPRGRLSYGNVTRHCREFALFMREKGFSARDVLYSAEKPEGK